MKIPRALLRHTMAVENYVGSTATGPVYAAARLLRCYVEAAARSSRTPEARTTPGADKVICDLDTAITVDARVTVDGRVREVLTVAHFESRAGTPDHTELVVQ